MTELQDQIAMTNIKALTSILEYVGEYSAGNCIAKYREALSKLQSPDKNKVLLPIIRTPSGELTLLVHATAISHSLVGYLSLKIDTFESVIWIGHVSSFNVEFRSFSSTDKAVAEAKKARPIGFKSDPVATDSTELTK